MRFDDRILGGALAIFSICVIVASRRIGSVPGTTFGPDVFPTLIGIAMLILSVRIFVRAARIGGRDAWVDLSDWKGQTKGLVCATWILAGIVIGIAFFDDIGFPLFGLAYALPLMLLMGARPISAFVVTASAVLLSYFVFSRLLFVPLPVGPLTFLR
ncbi:tripartite tricarboxylate transporter TctB family protein [Pararhizobium mangrovi]|uniref:Tripartite tricarboxylate transporter TctB family protein n=1 Tax=Pararhizobium mangrovi TaxID=2590452 RepID=A0A506UBY4_9HYPH|nr:tripartite tricarboxylate transporter TctB family protein [Pararhizobium mangrovi]TPW30631.1 tripartite tricarboxylate transporter TctB family protein [Pararhizobium mangrovi]